MEGSWEGNVAPVADFGAEGFECGFEEVRRGRTGVEQVEKD